MTRLYNYLKEKYLGSFKVGLVSKWQQSKMTSDYIEVFVNPSKKEMLDASSQGEKLPMDRPGRNVRFMADLKKKKIYVWSPNITHHTVIKNMKNIGYSDSTGTWLLGTATQLGGKFTMTASDSGIGVDTNSTKWAWIDKYINVTNFLI